MDVKDYHPISFVNGVYNILFKVLVNRLSMEVEKLISKSVKTAKGSQILDLVLIAVLGWKTRV